MSQAHAEKGHGGDNHPLAGMIFLALAFTGIGYGALSATERAQQTAIDAERKVGEEIMSAVQIGREGNVHFAVKKLKKIVEHHPDNVDALYNLGVALAGLDRLGEAERLFDEVRKRAPGDWDAVAEKAAVRLSLGDVDAAFQLMESIPVGEGNLKARLLEDARWAGLFGEERMKKLMSKHGVEPPQETSTTEVPVAPSPEPPPGVGDEAVGGVHPNAP